MSYLRVLCLCISVTVLAACGQVSLSLTDAPVDDVDEVVLALTGIELQTDSSDIEKIKFNPVKLIDLLSLTDGQAEVLLDSESMPDGQYTGVKLLLDLDESFVSIDGANFPITIPSDALDGLQVAQNFEVSTGSDSQFTIDFDLRRSLLDPLSDTEEYRLRPVLRMVDNSLVGAVTGQVDASLLSNDAACFDDVGTVTAVVYVYQGQDVTPDDVDGITPEPFTSARVNAGLDYTVAFLEEGDYTLALTCEARDDDPSINDDIAFLRNQSIEVSKSETVIINFVL